MRGAPPPPPPAHRSAAPRRSRWVRRGPPLDSSRRARTMHARPGETFLRSPSGRRGSRDTEGVTTSPAARPTRLRGRPRFSVRTRIVAVITLVAALGLTVVGATVYLVERAVSLEAIEDRLQDNLDSARFIVAQGDDPTGSWPSADEALRAVVQRMSPDDNTGAIGIIDGRAVLRSGIELDLDLTSVPGFVTHVAEQVDGPDAIIGTYAEDGVVWRYLAAPIAVSGGPQAEEVIFALAYDVRAELAEIDGTARAYIVAAGIALLVIAAVATIVSTRLLRPLRRMRETAERVSAQALTERLPVQGRDDVSELASTMNDMLDRLDRA
ncbi:MAG: HAMP domain-containing protein, partial [Microbacterium sp.]